jgi:hypothetical protein
MLLLLFSPVRIQDSSSTRAVQVGWILTWEVSWASRPRSPVSPVLALFTPIANLLTETLVEGAKIPVKLGFGDISGTTGRYWANPGIADKGDGQVLAW